MILGNKKDEIKEIKIDISKKEMRKEEINKNRDSDNVLTKMNAYTSKKLYASRSFNNQKLSLDKCSECSKNQILVVDDDPFNVKCL